MWIRELADADAGCGGKAALLARLIAAGLPVPDGFALAGAAFRAIVGDDAPALAGPAGAIDDAGHALAQAARRIDDAPPDAEVVARAARLGVLAVRSSATIEDGDAGAAAGVFSSRRAVPAADAWAAIRAVWTSALTPLAIAYARRRGGPDGRGVPPAGSTAAWRCGVIDGIATVGVIVQRFVEGDCITAYTRTPAGADEVWVQRGGELTRHARGDGDRVVQLALAAEAAIGAGATGADVELVASAEALWIVQARPIVRAPARELRVPPPPIVLAALADGRRWTWDITHNPDPLSPAQAGLVARVAEISPWALRVCAGYLYVAARDGAAPAPAGDPHALEAAMMAALDGEPRGLGEALARYVAFYARWAELARYISDARRGAGDAGPTARPSAVEATLLAAARGELAEADAIARLAPLSPAWDVAVPTFGERPGVVRDAIARAAGVPSSPASPAPASALADLAERDDHAFAHAQRMVRRALLARADELAIDRDDMFWLPLDEVVAARELDRDAAHRRAAAARAAGERAARWDMPLVVGGGGGGVREGHGQGQGQGMLRGLGHGARVTGRVVRFASLASAIAVGRGDIVVTRAVTPALAVLVAGCAAIVSETGGLLDHGAALARELGVPCVVGCRGAWRELGDGEIVRVDGDAGTVTPL